MIRSRISIVVRIVVPIGTERSGIGKDKCPDASGSRRAIVIVTDIVTVTAIVIAIAILIAISFRFVVGSETRQDPNPHLVEAKPGARQCQATSAPVTSPRD